MEAVKRREQLRKQTKQANKGKLLGKKYYYQLFLFIVIVY